MSLQDNSFVITTDIHNWEIVRSADPTDDGQWMRVTGWATDTSRDKRDGIVYPEAIENMVRIVKERSPLYRNVEVAKRIGVDVDHSKRYDDQIGYVEDAEVLHNVPAEALRAGVKPPVMQVTMMVDLEMPAGKALQRSLSKGYKLGLSIFGEVLRGYRKVEQSTGKVVEHFVDVALKKVAVTSQPVNPNTWVATVARSMNGVEMLEETTQEAPANTLTDILDQLDAEAEVVKSEAVETEAAPAPTNDITAWALAHEDIVRSLMAVGEDALVEALEGNVEKSEETHESEKVPATTDTPDSPGTSEQSSDSQTPLAETEVVKSEADEAIEDNPNMTLLFRSLFNSEFSEVKKLLEPLADFVERSERADADLQEANTALTEELTQIKSEMEVLRSEVKQIGDTPTGRRGIVARGMGEGTEEPKSVEDLPVVWDDLPHREKLDKLATLNEKDPIQAAKIVLKLLRDPGPTNSELTPAARKLAETPA